MPSSKTTNLDLNVGYAETDRTQSWIAGIDDNFRNLDNSLGTVFKAIESAGITLSRNVALEDEWSTGAYIINTSFLSAFKNGAAVRFGSYVYVFIGSENSTGEVYKFNIVKYTLVKLDIKLPYGFTSFRAEQYQGKIFLLGGCINQIASNLFYIFDIATEELESPEETLVMSVSSCGSCIVDEYIYLFGGINEANIKLNTILKFNTKTYMNSILSVTLPEQVTGTAACADGTNIYLFGGNASTKIYNFDPINNTIIELSKTLPVTIDGHASILLNNNIYIFGGRSQDNLLATVYKFDLNTELLSLMSFELPTALADFAVATTDSYGYLFGGENETGISSRIIRFVP